MNRRQFLRRFPKPTAPEDGMYIVDRDTGEEVFVLFTTLSESAHQIMTMPEGFVEDATGKMPWQRDPTYNMKRKR